MKYITRREAHLKSRFLNESLEGFTILDEEIMFENQACVLINDKEMLNDGLFVYARKNDVRKILENYNKFVLTDIYAFNEAYTKTFPDRNDDGIVITEASIIGNAISKLVHLIFGTVGVAQYTGFGDAANAADFLMYTTEGVMDLKENPTESAIKFVRACLSVLSEVPGAVAFTKPAMAVVGSLDIAKTLFDKLPTSVKVAINKKVQQMLSDTAFENKINEAVQEFKKSVKENGVSGTMNKGIDKATGETVGKVPLVGGALSTVAGTALKAQNFVAGKGADLVIKALEKAGIDPISAIPDNLGSIILKAFRDFASKVFGTGQTEEKPAVQQQQYTQQPVNQTTPQPKAAMRNR